MSAGTLYIVSTPIGNLEDITYRAVRVLQTVDLIACEDTRHSRHLLDHYGIDKPLVSYHEHNEITRTQELLERLHAGANLAIISDAGTPLISDPGYRLVSEAAAGGIKIVPVPGPSAAVTALTASGLPTDCFYFGGFLPAKSGARRRALEQVKDLTCSLIFYEAPHRICEALADIGHVLGPRPLVVSRELTKLHEEVLRGTADEVLETLTSRNSIKGEITIVIGKPVEQADTSKPVFQAVEELIQSGVPMMEAIKTVARTRGLPKRDVYAEYERSRR